MPPTFDTDTLGPSGQQYCLVRIWTYHFNFGKGAPPGEVGLKDDSGAFVAGPVAPVGSTGAFNTPNANWDATFPTTQPIVLHGTYSVFDSDPATWFNNDMSKGFGFAQVWVENYLPSNP
jgi:hypothetical protein